MLSHSLLYY